MNEHNGAILEEFREQKPIFEMMRVIALEALTGIVDKSGVSIDGMTARVKKEESLAGKLELKGQKYHSLSDITDILGVRIVTFFGDDVDRLAETASKAFVIDWENSVDKRKLLDPDRFGYLSLHYICQIPKTLYFDENCPELNQFRFELQIRTTLQHVWASIYHDTGYKSDVEVPGAYIREFSRLAGLLEIADAQFMQIRDEIGQYRADAEAILKSGQFDLVKLDGDTFRLYLQTDPFGDLIQKIARLNRVDIYRVSEWPYLGPLKKLGMVTIGDIEKMKAESSAMALRLIARQIRGMDVDIMASTTAVHNLCIVHIVKLGGGEADIRAYLDAVYGSRKTNAASAKRLLGYAAEIMADNQEEDHEN